jgi:hypothetical protein
MIDQSLFEAAREIERHMPGHPAADKAWDVFFGRAGGGILWNDCLRIKASYRRAAALNVLKRRTHRRMPRCLSVDTSGEDVIQG